MSEIVPYSDNSSNIQHFDFNGLPLDAMLDRQGDPWFIASEVCKILGISNVGNALARLDSDEKDDIRLPDVIGRMQDTAIVNEPGLYVLVMRSDKPVAKDFKRWIAHKVLPALRKTGSYSLEPMTPLQQFKALVAYMEKDEAEKAAIRREVKEIREQQGDQALDIEVIKERLDRDDWKTIKQWCIDNGWRVEKTTMQEWGRAAATLSRVRGIEIIKIPDGTITVGAYHKSVLIDACVVKEKKSKQPPLL